MGKAIEEIALKRGHSIAFKVNTENPLEVADLRTADVCIEFTKPSLALQHIYFLLEHHMPTVVGTTGWNQSLKEVEQKVKATNGNLVYASNFSIGVNLFFQLNEYLAKLMSDYTDYQPQITEIHHTQKVDYPSGTAISLAEGILANHSDFTSWKAALNEFPKTEKNCLPIQSQRIENVPGTHQIVYHSEVDSIKIEHIANNRMGFALGAVMAAEWIVKNSGLHTFKETLKL